AQLLESGKDDCLLHIGPGAYARSPEPPAEDFDQPPVGRQACGFRASDRLRQKRKVRRRGVRDTGVDPIDRKVDENLGQNPVDGWAGNIARRQIALRDLIKCAHDAPELRREALLENLAASRLLLAAEIAEPATDA